MDFTYKSVVISFFVSFGFDSWRRSGKPSFLWDLVSSCLAGVTGVTGVFLAKISDFGTSRMVSDEAKQEMTAAIGTPSFMAPEVLV